jgi:DNA end-binding protein Ku
MKAIWTGTIGFGLVNIPIKMYSAVQTSELDLDMLDKKDLSNIHFKRVNANTGKEVTWDNIVRGFKIDERYVVLNDEDIEKAYPEKTKMIEIIEFIKEEEINSIYYETPYYLEPEHSGIKAYALLRDALKKTGKAGLGTFVMRTKESLCLIKPIENVLMLNKIRFKQEIREITDLAIPVTATSAAEIKMAIQLIDQLTGNFDISKYKDTYSEELMKLIKEKAKGKITKAPQLKVVHSKTKDLMTQLKESLQIKSRKAS